MSISLRNNRSKFYLDLIWNDGALGFLKTNNKKISVDMGSAADPKIEQMFLQNWHLTWWQY